MGVAPSFPWTSWLGDLREVVLVGNGLAELPPALEVARPLVAVEERRSDVLERRHVTTRNQPVVQLDVLRVVALSVMRQVTDPSTTANTHLDGHLDVVGGPVELVGLDERQVILTEPQELRC